MTFLLAVLVFLALEVSWLHRKVRVVRFGEVLGWTAFLLLMAIFLA